MSVMVYGRVFRGFLQERIGRPLLAEIIGCCMDGYTAHPAFKSTFKAVLLQACEDSVEGIAVDFLRHSVIGSITANDAEYERCVGVIKPSLRGRLVPATSSNKQPQPIRNGFRGCWENGLSLLS